MLPEQGELQIEEAKVGPDEDLFSAVYKYKGRFHRREIRFRKAEEEIEVRDSCSHKGAMLSFVCAPGLDIDTQHGNFQSGKVFFRFDGIKKIEVEQSYCSPSYGIRIPNKIMRVDLLNKTSSFTIGLRQ